MKKLLLLLFICVACFGSENESDLKDLQENQAKQLFYLQVISLLLGCSSGLQTVQLMIHAKNQKNLI